MKNIHILPTENSSRISHSKDGVLELHRLQWRKDTQNIYITSGEIIERGDWIYDAENIIHIYKASDIDLSNIRSLKSLYCKKIILTTDQDLIKCGVQAIDDEFLEWFVSKANDSGKPIDIVEVDYRYDTNLQPILDSLGNKVLRIKIPTESENLSEIIIPKEEAKQETQEEASERMEILQKIDCDKMQLYFDGGSYSLGFNNGAKWQQEQDKNKYSEVFEWLANKDYLSDEVDIIQKEFEQFKKK